MILGNFTPWKFPTGITWFLGKQTNKPVKNGTNCSALTLLCLSELTDKDRKDEERACHELYELFKTKNVLVPLHPFIFAVV